MQFTLKLIIGESEITITDEAADIKDFFKKAAMWQSIPTTGPGGERDVRFRYVKTKQDDYEYYSVISDASGKEFKFGQVKKDATRLYPKGWAPIFGAGRPDEDEDDHQLAALPKSNGNGDSQATAPSKTDSPKWNPPGAERLDATTFWKLQRQAGVNKATADDIVRECTSDGMTDWTRAYNILRDEMGGH